MTAPVITVAPTFDTIEASTTSKALLDGLKFVGAALPSRPPMRVLLGVKITAYPDGVSLAGFDYELSATELIVGSGTGEVLVPGQLLLDLVKTFEAGTLALSTVANRLVLTQGDLVFTVPLLPLADYPELPSAEGDEFATLTGAELVSLNRAQVAVGRDDTLPVLTAIMLESEDGTLTAVSTDRYRLAKVTSDVVATKSPKVLVPRQSLDFLAKHFAKADTIELRLTTAIAGLSLLSAVAGSRTVTTRLLEGEFPKYRSLLPETSAFTASATVDIPGFIKAVKQVAVAALRQAPVRLGCSEAGILLESGGQDDAQASRLVRESFTGEPLKIAYNPLYLIDGLTCSGKKWAKLNFTSATRPGTVTNPEDPTFTYLLMPVRLSG